MSKEKTAGSSLGGTVLFLIFLVLKLTGTIAWSWWWVTSPLWIPVAIILVVLIIFAITAGIIAMLK
mgnify:CR=1 FL=1